MFCQNCGKEIDDKAVICPHCGVPVTSSKPAVVSNGEKEWLVTLLLCIFLGGFGIHRFYVGKTGTGIAQLVLTITIVGSIITAIWVFIDLILIVTKKFTTADGKVLV